MVPLMSGHYCFIFWMWIQSLNLYATNCGKESVQAIVIFTLLEFCFIMDLTIDQYCQQWSSSMRDKKSCLVLPGDARN